MAGAGWRRAWRLHRGRMADGRNLLLPMWLVGASIRLVFVAARTSFSAPLSRQLLPGWFYHFCVFCQEQNLCIPALPSKIPGPTKPLSRWVPGIAAIHKSRLSGLHDLFYFTTAGLLKKSLSKRPWLLSESPPGAFSTTGR